MLKEISACIICIDCPIANVKVVAQSYSCKRNPRNYWLACLWFHANTTVFSKITSDNFPWLMERISSKLKKCQWHEKITHKSRIAQYKICIRLSVGNTLIRSIALLSRETSYAWTCAVIQSQVFCWLTSNALEPNVGWQVKSFPVKSRRFGVNPDVSFWSVIQSGADCD